MGIFLFILCFIASVLGFVFNFVLVFALDFLELLLEFVSEFLFWVSKTLSFLQCMKLHLPHSLMKLIRHCSNFLHFMNFQDFEEHKEQSEHCSDFDSVWRKVYHSEGFFEAICSFS